MTTVVSPSHTWNFLDLDPITLIFHSAVESSWSLEGSDQVSEGGTQLFKKWHQDTNLPFPQDLYVPCEETGWDHYKGPLTPVHLDLFRLQHISDV